jgi:UDP-2-acetamido-2-deoxy-ribo-hexuluronate aminotransferase
MKIDFLDMRREAKELISNNIMKNIKKTISSGNFLLGEKTLELENYMSNYFNKFAVTVGSGTDALELCLRALNISTNDKVAIPAFTAIPTAIAVKSIGAKIVYIDINETMTMDCNDLEDKLKTNDIKAIIPVHLFGNVANIKKIKEICKDIPVIEDCAQSFGSKCCGKLTGTFGTFGAFSFYPTKNLGTFGDGGLIVTSNKIFADKIKELRFYGQKSKYSMGEQCGINSRIDEIQATVLLKKLETFSEKLETRSRLKEKYISELKNKSIAWSPEAIPHLFPLFSNERARVMKELKQRGVVSLIHYPFCLSEEIDKIDSKNLFAKKISESIFSIPFHPWLRKSEVKYLIKQINSLNLGWAPKPH